MTTAEAAPRRSPTGRRRWKPIAALTTVAVVAVVVALAVIPVTHRFSDTLDATHEFGTVSLIAPTGSAVALSWSVTGGPASIQVFNGNGQILDASEAPVGSFSFSSTTPSDGFEANSTGTASVSVSWSYASPIL